MSLPTQSVIDGVSDWVLPLARYAGDLIMDIYHQASQDPKGAYGAFVRHKSDHSPLTRADLLAHHAILEGLLEHCPGWQVISEESFEKGQMDRLGEYFWLVDPLDGTKEFLAQTGEFTVNIALIHHRQPIFGVVYQPAADDLYWGGASVGAWRQQPGHAIEAVHVAASVAPPWRVMASRSHLGPKTQRMIERMGNTRLVQSGSSLKFCRIAAGEADFYPRLGFTSQWDTAAAQAVLEGAGGFVIDAQGRRLLYGQSEIINPDFLATALPFDAVRGWWGDA